MKLVLQRMLIANTIKGKMLQEIMKAVGSKHSKTV